MKKLVLGLVMALMLGIGMLAGTLLTKAAQAEGTPPKTVPVCACQEKTERWRIIQLAPVEKTAFNVLLFDTETGATWSLDSDNHRWRLISRP